MTLCVPTVLFPISSAPVHVIVLDFASQVPVVDPRGMAPGIGRSIARYLLAWLWFLPALVALSLIDVKGTGSSALAFAVIGAGVLTYALLSRAHPQRQFVHDALCGTRLVTWRAPPKKNA